jgi:hypothetical protein
MQTVTMPNLLSGNCKGYIDSTFGSLTQFADAKWLRTLLDRNNDPEDDFHFGLSSLAVIGRDINASRDIVHINLTSPWFLFKFV